MNKNSLPLAIQVLMHRTGTNTDTPLPKPTTEQIKQARDQEAKTIRQRAILQSQARAGAQSTGTITGILPG